MCLPNCPLMDHYYTSLVNWSLQFAIRGQIKIKTRKYCKWSLHYLSLIALVSKQVWPKFSDTTIVFFVNMCNFERLLWGTYTPYTRLSSLKLFITWFKLVYCFFMTCSWLFHFLLMTCSWIITCSLLVHNLFTNCLFMTCPGLVHNLFTIFSWLVNSCR